MNMRHHHLITFVVFTLLAVLAQGRRAQAFTFSPIVSEFTPSGAGATRTFTVENKGADRIPVQISAHTRQIGEDGREALAPTEHFKIFPEQFTLAPQQTRAVRITYRGPANLASEAAYRFIAEQLPIDLQKAADAPADAGKIKFLLRYEGSVYVQPPKVRPEVKAEASLASSPKTRERELELLLRNEGTAHQLLNGARLTLVSAAGAASAAGSNGASVTLEGPTLKVFEKQNLLAGARRRFKLPWPEKLPAGPVTVSIEFP